MRRVAALLAVLALLPAGAGCGEDAEPGAPQGATLMLDFVPNAAHTGIYAALERGLYEDDGIDLTVRAPGDSTDAPKLLAAGRTDFAVLDIHDAGIARASGLPVVCVAGLVQKPLASVIARRDSGIERPRELEGRTVGVTGLPSDDAVLDSVVAGDGGDPAAVHRVTIGFNAVGSLAAGRVDAATGFWNAEAVALRDSGVPARVFRVDRYGAPPYPELVLCTSERLAGERPGVVDAVAAATASGYRLVARRPARGLAALLEAQPRLEEDEQRAQLRALLPALTPAGRLDPGVLRRWARWDLDHGILGRPLDPDDLFRPEIR
jgi:NitT/TauT family transport system substrate-binding protein/putative hydroxymethylpyrimidine transport system substrate-binding protein